MDLARFWRLIWVEFGRFWLCFLMSFWKPSGTPRNPPEPPSRSPGGPKIGWGSPGGLLGVPWGLLGGLWGGDPGGPPPEDDPKVNQADFWSPPGLVPGWLQMLANGSKC